MEPCASYTPPPPSATPCVWGEEPTPARPSPRDPRVRAVVYGAIECARALVAGWPSRGGLLRGRHAALWILDALAEAWRQGVDLDAPRSPEELQERLLAGGYLERRIGERALREALALLVDVCPLLVVRVGWSRGWVFAVPLHELRAWGDRCQRLAGWVDRVRAVRYERTPECARRAAPNSAEILADSQERTAVSDPRSKDHARTLPGPRGYPADRDDVARARRALEKFGPALEGLGGDRRTYLALCLLGDFDLEPALEEELATEYGRRCVPPWRPVDLRRKLRSARRNRRSPRGTKKSSSPTRPPGAGETRPSSASAPPRPSASVAHTGTSAGSGASGERARAEVAREVWGAASPVTTDPEVCAWLTSRGLDPVEVARQDLARVLERVVPELHWPGTWGTWRETSHRLILPALDARGDLATIRGRYVGAGQVRAKEVSPVGSPSRGAALANAAAATWLRGQLRPEGVWVVEGGPDFLALATHLGAPDPILGLWSGAWDPEIWTRVPIQPGLQIVIATHADAAGDAIAAEVLRTLPSWAVAVRAEAVHPGWDLGDLAAAGELDAAHLLLYAPR